MAARGLDIGFPIQIDRSMPPQMVMQLAQAAAASGAVDYLQTWDQLTNFWPGHLWTPETTPLAAVSPDPDSQYDAFLLAGIAGATSKLGVSIATDAIRRGPAELMQTMLTLANTTEGRAMLLLGAGEMKHMKPFGHKRSEGIPRLEDHFRIAKLLWETDGPASFEGNIWKFKDAWLGGIRPHRPEYWALGAGPRLLDFATEYADGVLAMAPNVYPTPERWHEMVQTLRSKVAGHGRDPDAFGQGLWVIVAQHEDPEVIEQAMHNPILRYIAACFGRLEQRAWADEGIESAFPHDWHYALKLLPNSMSDTELDDVISRVTPEMVRRSFVCGNAEEVTQQVQPYIDAGANYVSVLNFLAVTRPVEEAMAGLEQGLQVCATLKKNAA